MDSINRGVFEMKSTGIVRKVDELGRIVIPIELRRVLGIEIKEAIEIFVDRDQIILKKYEAANQCIVTGNIDSRNISICDGKISISPEGADILIKELQSLKATK